MDDQMFDQLAKRMTRATTRRQALKLLTVTVMSAPFVRGAPGSAQARAARLRPCLYQFSAKVRSGPSRGLALDGQLLLLQWKAHHVTGVLIRRRARPVRVVGVVQGNVITLNLRLRDGRRLRGTGRWHGAVGACAGTSISGQLAGPLPHDQGDWAGQKQSPPTRDPCDLCYERCSRYGDKLDYMDCRYDCDKCVCNGQNSGC